MADTSATQITASKTCLTNAANLAVKLLSQACGGAPGALTSDDYAAYDMFESYVSPGLRIEVRRYLLALGEGITDAPSTATITAIGNASVLLTGVAASVAAE